MFNRGIRLPFKLLGIPLWLDWSFLFILPLLVWTIGERLPELLNLLRLPADPNLTQGSTPYLLGLLAAVGLFTGVVLHELGHAVTARAYGVKVQSITLWFLGGVARFEEMPRQPGAEAVVAIAGPIVSIALGALSWIGFRILPDSMLAGQFVLRYLAYVNIVLAIFNMIPALPLDGGRVLRSLLALRMPHGRATQIAGWISRTFAVLLGIFGLLSFNFFMLLIAIFIYLAITAETRTVRLEELLRGVPVRNLMNPMVSTVMPDLRVGDLAQLVWTERHMAFPVVDPRGTVLGIIHIRNTEGYDPDTPVGLVMGPMPTINLYAEAAEAFQVMLRNDLSSIAVVDADNRLAGIVTKTDLMRLMQLRSMGADMPGESLYRPTAVRW